MDHKIKKIDIAGMHCKSCEIIIEKELAKIPGVSRVKASQASGQAEISYNGELDMDKIGQAVKDAGYNLGKNKKLPFISRDANDYKNLGIGIAIITVLFIILKSIGLFGLNVNTQGEGVWIALLVGLVAGVSTCMALVGGLILGLAARHSELHPEATKLQKFRPHLFFNLGRIAGFGLLGGFIGLIGTAFKMSPNALGIVTMIVGAVMIFTGLKLVEIFPFLKNKTLSLPPSVAKIFGLHKSDEREYSHVGAAITGALTFFLPCGFTQAMQIFAVSTGSFYEGALIMSLFALGTTPGLLGIGGLTSLFTGKKARIFYATAGIAVILMGFFNIANGSNLIYFGKVDYANASTKEDVQVVNMTQSSNGYSPNSFTVQAGKPVKWVINSDDPFSCASSLIMPQYGVNVHLKKGQNVVNFTPAKNGKIKFSCSMGMYTGEFIVVDSTAANNSAAAGSASTDNYQATGNSTGASCGVSTQGQHSCGGSAANNDASQSAISARGGCGCGGASAQDVRTTEAPAPSIDNSAGSNVQVIKTTYTSAQDISPNTFTVKKGQPVRFEIYAKDNGSGCMSTIKVQGLYENAQYLQAGKTIVMEFTPRQAGTYLITCAMNVPRGTIKVE